MKTKGTLTLIPTPINDEGILEPTAFKMLLHAAENEFENSIFVIEDLKPGRKRWLSFGLPRFVVDHFVLYNEHTAATVSKELLNLLLVGKNVYLMSDGGLPAFYDPGIELVRLCHQNSIKVTSSPFPNSIALALALSGVNHRRFWFEGFLPLDQDQRKNILKKNYSAHHTSILMDTPYRLKRLLEELLEVEKSSGKSKTIFLAMDLNMPSEELHLGTISALLASIQNFKREFILIISE